MPIFYSIDDSTSIEAGSYGSTATEYDSDGYPVGPVDFTPATRFNPPKSDDTPQTLFSNGHRFLRHSNPRQMLVYTDGACLNNGRSSPVGGCAFVFKGGNSPEDVTKGIQKFRLEDRGPSGVLCTHTSNRAELRAVIAALQFRAWYGEGYSELVIATDSEYVVLGVTQYVTGWVRRGWRTSNGTQVKNMDLWESLFKEIQRLKSRGTSVLFWRIPRESNTVADRAAKEAAATGEPIESFTRLFGVLV